MKASSASAMRMFYLQLLIVLLLFACDQLTKIWVSFALPDSNLLHINDWINIVSTWNSGVSFGMMKNIPPLVFVFINCVITGYLFYLLVQSQKKSFVVGLPYLLMIGGALGNLCDRIVYGAVYDFIDLHIANYHWPVFNLADVFVTIGGVLFVVGLSVQKEELCA